MKKSLNIFILSVLFFLFSFSLSFSITVSGYHSNRINVVLSEEPKEIYREYVLIGDQWFLMIYYEDGTIGVFPVGNPPPDYPNP